MKFKDEFNRIIHHLFGCGMCAALLSGTNAFAQNAILGPPTPNVESLPEPRVIGDLAQPKDAPKQKVRMLGKDTPKDKEEINPRLRVLPAPALEPGDEGLVISLSAALRLANVRAWDITIARQQLQIALAQKLGADVLWLPTLTAGTDYQYHSGPAQAVDGTTTNNSRSNLYTGGSPLAIFAMTDAIFTPLAARQTVRAQDANIQTAQNDTLTDLATTYFNLLESVADLASIMDVDRRAAELVSKVDSIAPGIVPDVEKARTRAVKANIEQVVETARQRWRTASAEVARIARLKPSVVLQPLEPAHMRITLVSPAACLDDLIPIALATRPEITFLEAQAAAARERERQEKWRPFLPTIIARGGGTTPPYPMAFGAYASGPGSNLSSSAQRSDWDLSAVWTLQNLGAGNVALIRERRREFELSLSREFRFRDLVAREVTVAWADLRSADRRVVLAERELIQAEISAKQNMEGVTQVKRQEKVNIEVIRPQEVVQSLQALNQAYFNYYGVVADYNRAQFRMYRALGSPAQRLEGHDGVNGPPLPIESK